MSAGIRVFKVTGRDQRWQHSSRCPNIFYALQYVGVGAEVTPLSWLAVRAGYRADVKGNDSNVFTGGVGFAPFSTVHVDLMGLYGEDETWGAGAQLSMTF